MGRGRDSRSARPRPGGPPAPPQYPGSDPYAAQRPGGQWTPSPPPHAHPPAPAPHPDEPEYFGPPGGPAPYGHGPGHGGGHGGYGSGHGGPHGGDDQGHTRAFTMGDPYGDGGYGDDDHVSTYRAGQSTAPPSGPRLHWKDLLRGLALHPQQTFWQMRDYQMWAPALIVTFLYGVFAVFGFEDARREILDASTSTSVPWVLMSALAMTVSALMLGAVTHALARQLGGDGVWAPTIGFSMLIMSMTDAPRLLFAMFLASDNGLVQILGWGTWLLAGVMLTTMVSKSHDLPWPRALGAASIQLVALLLLLKLPTLS